MNNTFKFECDIDKVEKQYIYKTLYFFEKKINYKNIYSYDCNFGSDNIITIITINNIENIHVNLMYLVKFIFGIFNLNKNEDQIKESAILFKKKINIFNSEIQDNLNYITSRRNNARDIMNDNTNYEIILDYNAKLNKKMEILIKDLLKTDQEIEKINSYIEKDIANLQIDKIVEFNIDKKYYGMYIKINNILFVSNIYFKNEITKMNSDVNIDQIQSL